MPKFVKSLSGILVSLLIPLWVIIGAVRLVASETFISFEYNKPDFPQDVYSLSENERLSYAFRDLAYVQDDLPITALEIQRLGEQPMYNARELSHMVDVQNVYQTFWMTWEIITVLIIVIGALFYISAKNREHLAKALQVGGMITLGLIAAIGVTALVDWESWFRIFHEVLFAPGSWTFNPSDTLIRLFPHKFWMDAVYTVSGISATGGLAIGLIGRMWKSKLGRKIGQNAYEEPSNMALT